MDTETTNVTDLHPAADAADTETATPTTADEVAEPKQPTLTFRVLRRDENTIETVTRWLEEPARWSGPYHPTATEIGEMFGEGDYLLIELDSRYSFHSTYPMRVVAEKRYREAREDES